MPIFGTPLLAILPMHTEMYAKTVTYYSFAANYDTSPTEYLDAETNFRPILLISYLPPLLLCISMFVVATQNKSLAAYICIYIPTIISLKEMSYQHSSSCILRLKFASLFAL
ncbi:MAG: hypothetical protein H9802_10245 [Candidatus Phocaeicola faecipullorum]|nr:hypothetical protein [Candidatus Phocaeicola faecipullorum]